MPSPAGGRRKKAPGKTSNQGAIRGRDEKAPANARGRCILEARYPQLSKLGISFKEAAFHGWVSKACICFSVIFSITSVYSRRRPGTHIMMIHSLKSSAAQSYTQGVRTLTTAASTSLRINSDRLQETLHETCKWGAANPYGP